MHKSIFDNQHFIFLKIFDAVALPFLPFYAVISEIFSNFVNRQMNVRFRLIHFLTVMTAIKDYTSLINHWIDSMEYPSVPIGLYEPVKYMLAGGGKRLRPTLLCASAEAMGLDCECVKQQALGIEMFHNFTLLHDDVMDNADMRHGLPTVHRKWNISTAILSGDTMLTLASSLIGDCDKSVKTSVIDLFNSTAIQIYEGQQYDMNFENRNDVSIGEYVEMIKLKTAVLLGCACGIGVILAGGSADDRANMYCFGEQMGLAFQLRDDYLDTYGNPASFGKGIGGDILNDKKTWLMVKANEKSADRLKKIVSSLTGHEKIEAVTNLYSSLHVNDECMTEIERYTELALMSLDKVGLMSADFKHFFRNLAISAVKRDC